MIGAEEKSDVTMGTGRVWSGAERIVFQMKEEKYLVWMGHARIFYRVENGDDILFGSFPQ